MKKIKQLAKVFKALSNPHRLEIFLKILEENSIPIESTEEGKCCLIQSFIKTLKIGTPTVSHHLKELVNANLVETEKYGKLIGCRVNKELLNELRDVFSKTHSDKKKKNKIE